MNSPAAGEVHIWYAPLTGPLQGEGSLEQDLAREEVARAARFLNALRRDCYLRGRRFLRQTLARYLGEPPARLVIADGANGKPFLETSSLCFNLAHSQTLAVLAIASRCAVGVDLELMEENLPFWQIASRFFSPREVAELSNLPLSEQRHAFYRCWTRKEAYLKGVGSGFTQSAAGFAVTLSPAVPAALCYHETDPAALDRWQLADLALPPGFCGAIALAGELKALRYYSAAEFVPTGDS
jgi:4'-phosphopantetheinyl transferase